MRFQAILLVLFLLAGAALYLLNPAVVIEEKTVQLPGGSTVTIPLVATVLAVTIGAMLLMLLVGAVSESISLRRSRRFEDRVARQEREFAEMKGQAYDEVSGKLEAMRQDLTAQIDALARLVEDRNRELAGTR